MNDHTFYGPQHCRVSSLLLLYYKKLHIRTSLVVIVLIVKMPTNLNRFVGDLFHYLGSIKCEALKLALTQIARLE